MKIDPIFHLKAGGGDLFGSLILIFLVIITVLAGIALFLMPTFIKILLPGFSLADQAQAVLLSRILLISPLFLGLSNIFSSITQSFGRFFIYALGPVFYNLGIIFGILFFFPSMGFWGLGWGVALGAFLHMGVQLPFALRFHLKPSFAKIWNPELKKIIALSLPRTLGLATTQFTLTIFTAIASTLSHGSIAIFNLASNLQYLPISLIGVSYSVAAFPTLAALSLKKASLDSHQARQAREHFCEHFSTAFRHILFWALPAALLILVLRAQIVRVILGSGNFSWEDTRLTAAALFILSLAVVFQSLFTLLTRAFYAEGETMRPFAINLISMAISIGAAFWFVSVLTPGSTSMEYLGGLFRVSDIQDIRVLALPMGILSGSVFNFLFLSLAFRASFGWFPMKGMGRSIFDIALSASSGALSTYWSLRIFAEVFDLNTFFGIFFQGFLAGLIGVIIIMLSLWVLRNREFFEILDSIKKKISKEQVPAPEPDKLP